MGDGFDEQLMQRQIAWAHTYNAYDRIAGGDASPGALEQILASARREWRRTGEVPQWCGVDLLKAWVFYLTRADRHEGGYILSEGGSALAEWDAVFLRIGAHAGTRPDERPPLASLRPAGPRAATSTQPRMHRDPDFLLAKQTRWFEPHIAPINGVVQEISRAVGRDVPYVDPDCGGVNAKVLLLLEAPAGAAAHGSRMLSADNDDGTAANVWRAYQHSGLHRSWGMHWNAVPWYLGVPGKIRAATTTDVNEGRAWLLRLLDLLPDLRVLLTLGNRARDAVTPLAVRVEERGITVLGAPHPSQRLYNSTKGAAREEVHRAFARAVDLAGDSAEAPS